MKKVFLILFVFVSVQLLFSQGEKIDSLNSIDTAGIKIKRNGFYFELLGNAGLYSINYERMWIRKPKFLLISRVGTGFLPNGLTVNQSYLYEQNFCFGKKSTFLEIGMAYTLQRKLLKSCDEKTYEMDNMHWGLFRVGVRFQSDEKGNIFRIGILPIIYYRDACLEEWKLNRVWAGLSYGLLF